MPWRTEDGHEGPSLQKATAVHASAWLHDHFDPPQQMTEGWLMFGQEQGNRFDLLINDDHSAGLSARIDLRSNYSHFVAAVCELASITGCVLFSAENWANVQPTVADLCAVLKTSRAASFVSNPRSVLGGDHNDG